MNVGSPYCEPRFTFSQTGLRRHQRHTGRNIECHTRLTPLIGWPRRSVAKQEAEAGTPHHRVAFPGPPPCWRYCALAPQHRLQHRLVGFGGLGRLGLAAALPLTAEPLTLPLSCGSADASSTVGCRGELSARVVSRLETGCFRRERALHQSRQRGRPVWLVPCRPPGALETCVQSDRQVVGAQTIAAHASRVRALGSLRRRRKWAAGIVPLLEAADFSGESALHQTRQRGSTVWLIPRRPPRGLETCVQHRRHAVRDRAVAGCRCTAARASGAGAAAFGSKHESPSGNRGRDPTLEVGRT